MQRKIIKFIAVMLWYEMIHWPLRVAIGVSNSNILTNDSLKWFLWYSYDMWNLPSDIPMVLLWYSYDIPMILLWYSYDIPMVFLWYSYDIPMIFLCYVKFPKFFEFQLRPRCQQGKGIPCQRLCWASPARPAVATCLLFTSISKGAPMTSWRCLEFLVLRLYFVLWNFVCLKRSSFKTKNISWKNFIQTLYRF